MQKIRLILLVFVTIVFTAFCLVGCSGGSKGPPDGGQSNTEQSGTETEKTDSEGSSSDSSENEKNGGSWTSVLPFN